MITHLITRFSNTFKENMAAMQLWDFVKWFHFRSLETHSGARDLSPYRILNIRPDYPCGSVLIIKK